MITSFLFQQIEQDWTMLPIITITQYLIIKLYQKIWYKAAQITENLITTLHSQKMAILWLRPTPAIFRIFSKSGIVTSNNYYAKSLR